MADTPVPVNSAIIFIPGIERGGNDQSLGTITALLAGAMEQESKTARATFTLSAVRDESIKLASAQTATIVKACTISRTEDATTTPVADVFKIDYTPLFVGRYETMAPLQKGLIVLRETIGVFFRLLFNARSKAKSKSEKFQLFLAFTVLGLFCAYFLSLLLAFGSTIAESVFNLFPSEISNSVKALLLPYTANFQGFRQTIQTLTIVVTALALSVPKAGDIARDFNNLANSNLALTSYLSGSDRFRSLGGDILSLLDNIASRTDVEYQNIYMVGYSFGTILAIDTLFPPGTQPPETIRRVTKFVSIASPFDFVRVLYRDYFTNRQNLTDHQSEWANIWSPHDVLSSNLRDDSKVGDPTAPELRGNPDAQAASPLPGIHLHNIAYALRPSGGDLSWGDMLALRGISGHTRYWERGGTVQVSVFNAVVKFLYGGTDVLK
jgi:hypothetical protein